MDTNKVKGRMTEMQISGKELAKELNMDPSTFYRKMQKNGENFTLGEIMGIKRVLKMDDRTALDFLLA
jgi:hypothetical protein